MTVSTVYYPTHMERVRKDSFSFIQLMVDEGDTELLCSKFNLPSELEVRDLLSVWEVDSEYSSLLIDLIYGTSIIEDEASVWELIYVLKYTFDVCPLVSVLNPPDFRNDRDFWTRSFKTILTVFIRSPKVQERALEVLGKFIWEYGPETTVDETEPMFYYPSSFVLHYKLIRSTHYDSEHAEMMTVFLTELASRLSEQSVSLDGVEASVKGCLDSVYESKYSGNAESERLRKQLWLDYLERVIFSLVGHQHSSELFGRIASLRHPVWQEVYHSEDEVVEWNGEIGRDRYTQQICWDESGFPTGYSTAAANYRGND